MDVQHEDDKILHENAVKEVVQEVLSENSSGINEIGPFEFNFNDENILTGKILASIEAGKTVYSGRVHLPTGFIGTTPSLNLTIGAVSIIYGWRLDTYVQNSVSNPNISVAGLQALTFDQFGLLSGNFTITDCPLGGDLVVIVDDGSGSDSECSQGSGLLYLTVGPTPV